MSLILSLHQIKEMDREQVGGKAFALAISSQSGMNVPDALCVKTDAYNQFLNVAGLRERILLEVNRKNFQEMRWEEMWDASLRIRNMFLKTPTPPGIAQELRSAIKDHFGDKAVVVRSSAPGEDSPHASFAGLHESYVNVRGTEAILEHVRLVWASLWSDAALLYRQELGLDIEKSAMAVLIQEIVNGERSGVAFSKNPNDGSQSVIESVYGLNAGLVDGTVEPDRWLLQQNEGVRS
jgi:phosphoenolpyruvate synthase/pyruvate phosphate dikinase